MVKLFIALVVAAIMVIPFVASANLLGDPGFEGSGAGPWSYYESNSGFNENFDATSNVHSGSQALEISWTSMPAWNISETKQELSVIAGQMYHAEAYAKVTTALNNATAYLETIFVDTNGSEVGSHLTSAPLSAVVDWTKLTNSGVVPAGAVKAKYRLIAFVTGNNSTGGTVYFDDVYIPELIISNIQVTNVTQTSATVTWQTDVPSNSCVEPHGFYKLYDTAISPDVRIQGLTYCVTAAKIDEDLQEFAANNVNAVNIYGLGGSELNQADPLYNTLEERIFAKCDEFGLKFVVRLETYQKPGFDWRPQDADWIIDTYYANTIQRANVYSDSILYYLINIPLDDTSLRNPTEAEQRSYAAYFYNRMKTINPNAKVFANVYYGAFDGCKEAPLGDIVDGISLTQFAVRVAAAPYGLNYDTNNNGKTDPGEGPVSTDPNYKIIDKDQYDYFIDKAYTLNEIGSFLNTKQVYLDSGFADLINHWGGICADRTTKLKAISILAKYVKDNPQLNGLFYFKDYDKNDENEQGAFGILDTKLQGNASESVTSHTVVLTDLFPGTYYKIAAKSASAEEAGPTFTTSPATPQANDIPTITVTSPGYEGTVINPGDNVTIAWRDEDVDDNATVSLYYDTNFVGHDGVLIVSGLSEATTSYVWDTANLPQGASYYIYAKIDDGVNQPEYDYSDGKVCVYPFASASSSEGAGYEADKAFDGNLNTRWSSTSGVDPQWIQLDFGRGRIIYRTVLNWETAYATAYEIQVSGDGVNWTAVYSTTTGDGGIDDISFAPVTARYMRMHGTQRGTQYGYSLWEFTVYLATSANLLGDPGFEGSGAGPWSYYESNSGFNENFDATSNVHSGSQALEISWASMPAWNISETKQELSVIAGQMYHAEVYAKVTTALNNATAYLETIFVDTNGSEVGSHLTSAPLSAVVDWTKLTNSGVVPAGAVKAKYRLIAFVTGNNSTGGTVYFDGANATVY